MAEGLNTLILVSTAALLIEAVIETFKTIADCAKNDWKCIFSKLGAIVVGIVIAFTYGLSLPDFFGFSAANLPFISQILTGILISRGSNFIHDLFDKIQRAKAPAQLLGTIIPAVNANTNMKFESNTGSITELNINATKDNNNN